MKRGDVTWNEVAWYRMMWKDMKRGGVAWSKVSDMGRKDREK